MRRRHCPLLRLATLAALCVLLVAGCQSARKAQPQRTDITLDGGGIQAVVSEHADGRKQIELEAVLGPNSAAGQLPSSLGTIPPTRSTPLARVDHVRLVLASASGDRLPPIKLPFQGARLEGGTLVVECVSKREHRAQVIFRPDGEDGLHVEVRDHIALRSRVLELTLDYELTLEGPIEDTQSQHLHTALDEVVGDVAFHTPVTFVRSGDTALGLVVDTESLREDRRLPQALELRAESNLLRHGLIRYETRETAASGTRCTREGASSVSLRNETVRFAHSLRGFGFAELFRTEDSLHLDVFQRLNATRGPGGTRSGALGTRAIEDHIDSLVDRVSQNAWRTIEGEGDNQRSAWVSAPLDSLDDAPTRSSFGVKHQALRSAYAVAASRRRRGEPDLASVRGLVNLVLSAPRRGGMIPSAFESDGVVGGDGTRWATEGVDQPLDFDSGRIQGVFHAFDAACTGYWLLQLADLVEDRRENILTAAGELARFFVQNQRSSGSIPAFYSVQELVPQRDLFDEDSPESGACALFLAEYARRTADSSAADASERAMRFLIQNGRKSASTDFETLELDANTIPRTSPGVDGSLALIFATRAAFELHERTGRVKFLVFGRSLCAELATRQHIWSPGWLGSNALNGAIRTTNRDLVLGDPRAALAGEAFLRGYLATGQHDLLQRGIRALRSSLTNTVGPWRPETSPAVGAPGTRSSEWSDWGRLTAAAVYERMRDSLGQAIVDLDGGFGEGIDAVWLEDFLVRDRTISFRLLTYADLAKVRVHFRGVPQEGASFELQIFGQEPQTVSLEQLREGLDLRPTQVPELHYTPPQTLRANSAWTPRVRIGGQLPPGTTGKVVYRLRGGDENATPATIPLESATHGALPAQRPEVMALELGSIVETYALVTTPDGRVERLPRDGSMRRIEIQDIDAIDVGDGDEVELRDSSSSSVRTFVSGRENARSIPHQDQVTYDLTIPRTATKVVLRLLVSGAVRVGSGSHLLYQDEAQVEQVARLVELEIADPRLWRNEGVLELRIRAEAEAGAQLAKIFYRSEGEGTPLGGDAQPESPKRDADSRIRAWVLPLEFADAKMRTSPQDLNRAFFGGNDYRRTREPESRNTTGSVAGLVSSVSGGISEMRGMILDTLELSTPAAGTTIDEQASSLREQIETNLSNRIAGSGPAEVGPIPPDIVFVICPTELALGGRDAYRTLELRLPSESGTGDMLISAVVLTDREPDGSVVASGTAFSALLHELYGFEDLGRPESGNFGVFQLPRKNAGHTPNLPSGTNLARAAWASVVRVSPQRAIGSGGRASERLVGVSPLRQSRTFLRLPIEEIPGRGDLFVETHERSSDEPWEPSSGALVYWSFGDVAGARPFVRSTAGLTAQVSRLRLSPAQPSWQTAFTPAGARDLFRSSARLDGESTPSIATLQGEVVWAIRRLRTESSDGAVRLWLDYLPIDMLDGDGRSDAIWKTGSSAGLGPMSPGTGSVTRLLRSGESERNPGLKLESLQSAAGTSIRGRFRLPLDGQPRRIFVTLDGVEARGDDWPDDIARVRIWTGTQQHIDAPLTRRGLRCEFDVSPTAGSTLDLEIVKLSAEPLALRLHSLLATPRAETNFPIQLPESAESVRLSNGTTYGKTAVVVIGPDGIGRVSAPVVIPTAASALVLGMGLEDRAPTDAVVRVRGKIGGTTWHSVLDDFEVRRVQVLPSSPEAPPVPAAVAIVLSELPSALDPGVHFLDLEIEGSPGERLHFVTTGIATF